MKKIIWKAIILCIILLIFLSSQEFKKINQYDFELNRKFIILTNYNRSKSAFSITKHSKTKIKVPEYILGRPVKSLQYTFKNHKELESVILPKNLIDISDGTFYNCTALKTIQFPVNLETIGNSSFYGCKSLESLVLPSSVMWIDESAFQNCSNLRKIYIPDSVTEIGNYAFSDSPLVEIITPAGSTAEQYAIENQIPYQIQ